jgi:hypothetical protein
VGHTIRSSVLTNTPLRCEPGYSSYEVADTIAYSKFVEFYSLDFALAQAIQSPPPGFDAFRDQLVQYFVAHMDFYMAKLEWLRSKGDGVTISECYEGSTVVVQYAQTAQKLRDLYMAVRGEEWVAGGDGEFDPTKRIWYAECEPALIARAAPNGDGDDDDEAAVDDDES